VDRSRAGTLQLEVSGVCGASCASWVAFDVVSSATRRSNSSRSSGSDSHAGGASSMGRRKRAAPSSGAKQSQPLLSVAGTPTRDTCGKTLQTRQLSPFRPRNLRIAMRLRRTGLDALPRRECARSSKRPLHGKASHIPPRPRITCPLGGSARIGRRRTLGQSFGLEVVPAVQRRAVLPGAGRGCDEGGASTPLAKLRFAGAAPVGRKRSVSPPLAAAREQEPSTGVRGIQKTRPPLRQ